MQPPRDNAPKKPSTADWNQRRGTSISLGSIGQSSLRPSGGARPSLLTPKPVQAKAAPKPQTPPPAPRPQPAPQPTPPQPTAKTGPAPVPPSKPAPLPPSPKAADGASPQVSRAFMSGSLVPPRPLNQRPQAHAMPEFPKLPDRAARTPQPEAAPLPKPAPQPSPQPSPQAAPQAAAPESQARPGAPRAHGIAPVSAPKAEPEVLAAAAAPAAPRRPAKNVRQFNAAMAADARGPAAPRTGLFANKGLMATAAVVVVVGLSFGGWWFMTQRTAGPTNGIGSVTANEVRLAPQTATPTTTVADATPDVSTSAVTEAPSDAADAVSSVVAERPAERPAGPPTNFGALAPKGAPTPAAARAGRVVLADLPDSPDLGASTGRAEADSAPAPVPAPPPPTPVIRLPSGDEPFSTNTPNPEPGG